MIQITMKTFCHKGRFFSCLPGVTVKKAYLSILFLLTTIIIGFAQGTLTGFVVDDEFNEPLEKAVVTIPGTLISVLIDQQGKYVLKMRAGDYFMEVNYPGYFGKQYNMSVVDGIVTPMFIIKLKANRVGEDLQRRVASRENKREFPQAIEDFSTWQMTEQNGHQEFNEGLKTIPSANFLSNGSGLNDSETGFRGTDANRTSYTFNGILLNNPETGRVGSPMLSGLTDWAGNLQVTTGQAANLQSQTSSGGLVNVQSYLPHENGGVDVLALYGNEGFLKTSATVHSGSSKKGLASSIQISRTAGDGLAQNTDFENYGFFLNVQKEFNQFHTLVFNLNGVIQKYNRNFADSIGAYNLYGTKYNRQWGYLDGKPLSQSTNFGRSPLISLTHFWRPRIKTHVTTQIYAQFNRSAQLAPEGKMISQPIDSIPRDGDGHILFDQVQNWNKGTNVSGMGILRIPDANMQYINSEDIGLTTMAKIDRENRFGVRSVVTHQINKKVDFSGSFDLESYQATHFGAVYDLLGANGYTSFSDVNRPDGVVVENLFESGFFPSYQSADKTSWNYDSNIQTGGILFRLNYQVPRYFCYFEGAASVQNISRTDHFNYLDSDSERKSGSTILPGGRIQTGMRINLWKYHSVHFRANYGTYQPLFTALFPSGNNWKNQSAHNEQVFGAEVGYTIFSRKLKVEALAYYSQIRNHSMVRLAGLISGASFGLVNGLAELHQGVELKTSYKLTKNFQINLNGSLGEWKYSKDSKAQQYDAQNQLISQNELWLKGIRIANAPQISLFAEAEYRWAHNFYVRINYYRAEQIFAPFGLNDFDHLAVRSDFKQWQLPKYDLIGVSGNYLLKYRKLPAINLIFGGSNLLDTEYIEQSSTNVPEGNPGYTSSQVYYGMGRTWFAGIKVQF